MSSQEQAKAENRHVDFRAELVRSNFKEQDRILRYEEHLLEERKRLEREVANLIFCKPI